MPAGTIKSGKPLSLARFVGESVGAGRPSGLMYWAGRGDVGYTMASSWYFAKSAMTAAFVDTSASFFAAMYDGSFKSSATDAVYLSATAFSGLRYPVFGSFARATISSSVLGYCGSAVFR